MKSKFLTLLLVLCFFMTPVFAKNQTVYYEPKIVTLIGNIKLKTFPGPPNYESIEAGDDAETCPYLFLDYPIDVAITNNDTDPEAVAEKNVKIMQIAADEEFSNWSWSNKKYVNKHVKVTGTLYHNLTAHHHTRVLIAATHFEIIDSGP
jgi:hypothetical protein